MNEYLIVYYDNDFGTIENYELKAFSKKDALCYFRDRHQFDLGYKVLNIIEL